MINGDVFNLTNNICGLNYRRSTIYEYYSICLTEE